MHEIFTPQSLVEFLYSNPETQYDEETLNEIFADEFLLALFEEEATRLLAKSGRSCEPSKRSLLMVDQMAAMNSQNAGGHHSVMFVS
ncbi:MAG: hypothetical protein A2W93_14860 [Bacteroidetes bacterium GWF2_43_63]|nr:MAG: hypothetical protein A2W94_01430 [Bacteroidetes bacterium GWE2_42_42]OFY52618.1 MAG: hypothetical protein A2W93_14860 [Bacteroidetes bacterium GWF2_43_63]HBG69891.1 hypothetical protein [Bacteroidales bacterium]HCB62682.1 hypothetical protein [Bacteroidales bacterium]HCY23556.1 hypothetical protein [Bacteroidales bacterium]